MPTLGDFPIRIHDPNLDGAVFRHIDKGAGAKADIGDLDPALANGITAGPLELGTSCPDPG